MKVSKIDILFQEVPNEVSLAFFISWCNKRCKGCHSSEFWEEKWKEMTIELMDEQIAKSKGISCVLFFWGEWHWDLLLELIERANSVHKLKTCLYTWEELHWIPKDIVEKLTYIKTWAYIERLGGLSSPITNQRFYNRANWEDITHLFRKPFLSTNNKENGLHRVNRKTNRK